MDTADVVIAGAGIIGLSTALELASTGLRVTVVERGKAMSESSWAAAGMLAALDPENPPALRALAQLSLTLYPAYLAKIERLSALLIPLRTSRTLQGSLPGHTFPFGVSGRPLHVGELETLAPALITRDRDWRLLEEHSLDPRDLCAALPRAAAGVGVTLLEKTSVLTVEDCPQGVIVQTSGGRIAGGAFVNCSGAWAGQIAHVGLLPLPVKPRKGQMVVVGAHQDLTCVVRTPEVYLVPRRTVHTAAGSRVVIGATVEDVGFNKEVELGAGETLLARASALWPPAAAANILESWAGLRPGSPDGLPLIGPLTTGLKTHPNHWVATGHFRNGILLAPATARILSELIHGHPAEMDMEPFRIERFTSPVRLSDNAPARAL